MDRPEGSAGAEGETFVDAPRLMRELMRRKASILVPTLAAAGLGVAILILAPPRYTGIAKVLLENQESYLTRPDKALNDGTTAIDEEAVQSAAEGAATPDIARKAIEQLNVGGREEFNPSGIELIVSALTGSSRPSAGDPVVDAFLNHTTVFPIARSRIVQIEFSSRDPALAARGANELANLLLDSRADAKKAEARSAADWLGGRIDPLRVKVAEADHQLEAFRSSSGLLAGANGLTTPTQRLAEITTQAAAARAAQSAAKAKADALRDLVRSGRLDSVADVAGNDSLRRYAEARVALKAQIAEMSRTFGPEYPRMKEAAGQLAGLDEEIRLAAGKAVRGYEDEARIATDQVRDLDQQIAEQTRAVSSGDGDTVKLRALELDAKTARDQLESYLAKYREAIARESDEAGPPDGRIIETASPPSAPSFPRRGPVLLLTTLAGFVLSLGVAVARILMQTGAEAEAAGRGARPREPIIRDAPAPVALPVVAETAAIAAEPAQEAGAAAARADGDVASAVEALIDQNSSPPFVLMVTGEGARSALPAALIAGRRLAARSSAVLVDIGLSQPWLLDVVEREEHGESELPGIADLVAGRAEFDKVLHRDLSSRLDIVLPGEEPFETEDLDTILSALAENYDFVVIHASDFREPAGLIALDQADAVILCGAADKLEDMRERLLEARGEKPVRIAELPVVKASAIERAA